MQSSEMIKVEQGQILAAEQQGRYGAEDVQKRWSRR